MARLAFVPFYGIIQYVVSGKNGFALMIVYHIHLIEINRFLEDLFCQTKALRAFLGGQIRGVAYTLIEIQTFY